MTIEMELVNANGGTAPLTVPDLLALKYGQDRDRLSAMAQVKLVAWLNNNPGVVVSGGVSNFYYTIIQRPVSYPAGVGAMVYAKEALFLAITFTAFTPEMGEQ